MQIIWTERAIVDVLKCTSYLQTNRPEIADRAAIIINGTAKSLTEFPHRGRIGKTPNTRELIIPALPYILIYRVKLDQVRILRVLHTAQER